MFLLHSVILADLAVSTRPGHLFQALVADMLWDGWVVVEPGLGGCGWGFGGLVGRLGCFMVGVDL